MLVNLYITDHLFFSLPFPDNKPFVNTAILELEKKLSSATANVSCQTQHNSSYQQPHQVQQTIYQSNNLLNHNHYQSPPQQPQQPSSASLASILQVLRAERESSVEKRSPRWDVRPRSSSVDRTTPPPSAPGPRFAGVNFRKVHRHPPVSYPKKPLVTQRSLGSPPSPNVAGSCFSPPFGTTTAHHQPPTPSAFAVATGNSGQQRRPPYKSALKRNDSFLKTRSKTISDFFGPESTPISRLLNIICQEKEAERAQAIMSSSSGSSSVHNGNSKAKPAGTKGDGVLSKISVAPTALSSSSSSSSSSTSRVLRSRKENVIPVAANSHSPSPSIHSGSGGAATTEPFATKDIDRIAKYKADRRKPIYLRNTVQENENERLDNRKK